MLVQSKGILLKINNNIHKVCLQCIKEGYTDIETGTKPYREKVVDYRIENISKLL